jgi:hypothetical protein
MDLNQILLWAAGGVVFLVLLALALRLADLRSRLNALPKGESDIVTMLQRVDADAEDFSKWSNNAEERLRRLEDLMPDTLSQSGLIRYDAFPGLRGTLSRSVALLDAGGNGFVLTVLVNRDDNRFFVKSVTGGRGDEPLSPEEKSAVEAAQQG